MNKKDSFISEYIRTIYFLGTVRGDLMLSIFLVIRILNMSPYFVDNKKVPDNGILMTFRMRLKNKIILQCLSSYRRSLDIFRRK